MEASAGVTRMVPSAERSPVRSLPVSSLILRDLERGVKSEADHLGVVGRREGDLGLRLRW